MSSLKLSILDQSPVSDGKIPRDALRATLDLAAEADRLGYTRYWLAEHHNTPMLASASPEILIPLIASRTKRIRIGSGGVMLTHYSALKVAELFRMLETLFPGRIDMGLGRAPGSDGLTAAALRNGPGALPLDAYPEQVADALAYLRDDLPEDHRFHNVRAIPAGDTLPQPWLLGSAWDSASFAARMGLPFSFAQFISPDGGADVIKRYREEFRPSPWLSEPLASIGVHAICAESTDEARRLAMSRHLMWLRRRQGHTLDGGVPSVEVALTTQYTQPELEYIQYQQSVAFEGDPDRVKQRLLQLADEYDVDEVMVVTITHDYADRLRSYQLLAQAFDLTSGAETANHTNQ